jgi:hypothetical protein
MLAENRASLAVLIKKCGWTPEASAFALETLLNGVAYAVKNPADLMKNWHLEDNQWEKYGKHSGGGWESHISSQLYPAHSATEQAGKLV